MIELLQQFSCEYILFPVTKKEWFFVMKVQIKLGKPSNINGVSCSLISSYLDEFQFEEFWDILILAHPKDNGDDVVR